MTASEAIEMIKADIKTKRISKEYAEALNKAVAALESYTNHDGCNGCIHVLKTPEQEPCRICRFNYLDRYESEKGGRWVRHENGLTEWYACSECGGAGGREDKYCRHCGAEMGVTK